MYTYFFHVILIKYSSRIHEIAVFNTSNIILYANDDSWWGTRTFNCILFTLLSAVHVRMQLIFKDKRL